MKKRRESKTFGLPPGALVYVGGHKTEKVNINLLQYSNENFDAKTIKEISEYSELPGKNMISWFNIDGLHNIDIIEKTGKTFGINPLVLEDILNTSQRPKYEEHDNFLYFVMKMLDYDLEKGEMTSEQVSLILEGNVLLSFQEYPGDIFEPVRNRIRSSLGRIRRSKGDYLMYTLLDTVVDRYFSILEITGERIEKIEDKLLDDPSREVVQEIYSIKRELLEMRHAVWPLREALNSAKRTDSSYISAEIKPFLNDLYDHIIQVIDTVETYREMVAGMMDLYLSSVSNKMNEVMKVLTIIATLFIPLTFIAGVYGMNFRYMPELDWKWSYPGIWIIMIVIFVILLSWFRRKKWL